MHTEAESLIERTRCIVDDLRQSIDTLRLQITAEKAEARSVERAPVDIDTIRQRARFMVEKAAVHYAENLRFAPFAQPGVLDEIACSSDTAGASSFAILSKLFPEQMVEMIAGMAAQAGQTYSVHPALSHDDRRVVANAVASKIALLEQKEELALRKLDAAGDRSRVRRPDAPDFSLTTFGMLEAQCTGQPRERE